MNYEMKTDEFELIYGFPNKIAWNACFANASLSFLLRLQPSRTKPSDWLKLHRRLNDWIRYGLSETRDPPNLEMIVMLGFPGGRQECAQEFCTLWLERSLQNGVEYPVYWKLRTKTFCDLLPRGGNYKDSL